MKIVRKLKYKKKLSKDDLNEEIFEQIVTWKKK